LPNEYNERMAKQANAPASSNDFTGFSDEALEFLKKLKKNNKREWFQPRKAVFEEQLQKPAAALMIAIERELAAKQVPLKSNPKAVLSRIYRDVRFSPDKSPYYTFVSGALYRDGKKDTQGVLYVHIGENERFAAAGFWQPERPLLTNWRLRMQAEPQGFLNIVKQLRQKKLEISGEHRLQRMPRGFDAMDGNPLADFLRLQSFVVIEQLSIEDVKSPSLIRKITQFAVAAKPLLEYGWALPQAKPAVFVD
jgi:uncharacterized protein (TIGR02453 family)